MSEDYWPLPLALIYLYNVALAILGRSSDAQEESKRMIVRRRFTPALKARVVLELISGATSLAEAC